MPSSSTGTMRIKRLKKIKKRLEALCLSGHRNLISGKRIREAIKIVYVHFGKAGRVRERERERERERVEEERGAERVNRVMEMSSANAVVLVIYTYTMCICLYTISRLRIAISRPNRFRFAGRERDDVSNRIRARGGHPCVSLNGRFIILSAAANLEIQKKVFA